MNKLENTAKDLDEIKNQYEKLRIRNEQLGDAVMELQIQLNKMLKWKKSLKIMCFVMLCVCLIKLFQEYVLCVMCNLMTSFGL